MNNHETVIQHVRKVVPGLIALYRFGSQVQGETRPDSDVDLAILGTEPLSASCRFDLAQELATILHRDVDLIDLRSASTVLRMQILSTGECLFSGDDQKRQLFEMVVYSSYARLNEEREEILKDVRTKGSVYG